MEFKNTLFVYFVSHTRMDDSLDQTTCFVYRNLQHLEKDWIHDGDSVNICRMNEQLSACSVTPNVLVLNWLSVKSFISVFTETCRITQLYKLLLMSFHRGVIKMLGKSACMYSCEKKKKTKLGTLSFQTIRRRMFQKSKDQKGYHQS